MTFCRIFASVCLLCSLSPANFGTPLEENTEETARHDQKDEVSFRELEYLDFHDVPELGDSLADAHGEGLTSLHVVSPDGNLLEFNEHFKTMRDIEEGRTGLDTVSMHSTYNSKDLPGNYTLVSQQGLNVTQFPNYCPKSILHAFYEHANSSGVKSIIRTLPSTLYGFEGIDRDASPPFWQARYFLLRHSHV